MFSLESVLFTLVILGEAVGVTAGVLTSSVKNCVDEREALLSSVPAATRAVNKLGCGKGVLNVWVWHGVVWVQSACGRGDKNTLPNCNKGGEDDDEGVVASLGDDVGTTSDTSRESNTLLAVVVAVATCDLVTVGSNG